MVCMLCARRCCSSLIVQAGSCYALRTAAPAHWAVRRVRPSTARPSVGRHRFGLQQQSLLCYPSDVTAAVPRCLSRLLLRLASVYDHTRPVLSLEWSATGILHAFQDAAAAPSLAVACCACCSGRPVCTATPTETSHLSSQIQISSLGPHLVPSWLENERGQLLAGH